MTASHSPIFWRDTRMPHIELRSVADGRKVCYDLHSHTHWSLGAITQGTSTFIYRDDSYHVTEGDLVLMNPDWPHACNPIENQPWAYLMLYVDTAWLTQLRYDEGLLSQLRWQDIGNAVVTDEHLYQGYCTMAAILLDDTRELLDKQTQVIEYLSTLMHTLDNQKLVLDRQTPAALNKLAIYLNEHCTEELSLDELCTLSGYSPSYLIRSFRQHFGMTPHAYIVNKRIQYGQQQLKKGISIIDTALNAGFADQAHFQRTFKRLVAATPNQYRKSSTKH